jgi:hypothetical protein
MGRAKASAKPGESLPPKSIDALLSIYLKENPKGPYGDFGTLDLRKTKTGPKMLALDPQAQGALVKEIIDRLTAPRDSLPWKSLSLREKGHRQELLLLALRGLLRRKLPLGEDALTSLIDWIADRRERYEFYRIPLAGVSAVVNNILSDRALAKPLLDAMARAVDRLRQFPSDPTCRKVAEELASLIADKDPVVRLEPGEAWSDAVRRELAEMEGDRRRAWTALLASCQAAGNRKLTAKWADAAVERIEAVGRDDFRERLSRWFALVDRPPTVPMKRESVWEPDWNHFIRPPHVDLLKGLAWCAGFEADTVLARALGALAQSAYRKIPEKGPRLPALGNAAVAALGAMPGSDAIAQLALLKSKIKSIPAQQQIQKALSAAAERAGLPGDEIDELAVPTYGMDAVGHRHDVVGEVVADVVVSGPDVQVRWSRAVGGDELKSIPASVKKSHANTIKELKAALADIGKMLTAQRGRIDSLFVARKRWPIDAWRSRYLDHPLVGTIARRLIWTFEIGANPMAGIWLDDRLVGVDDRPLEGLGPDTSVELWHPIGRPVTEVSAWREWLEQHQVRQPFKQAHREVYILTDAERRTRVYSNRFAAHILRQHQYSALCAGRGWRNKLRLMVNETYPPTSKELPEWGLRAELWIEGVGDDYGRDTTESGAYIHVSTDQVRFYQIGSAQQQPHARGGGYAPRRDYADAEPVPLERVPPLVLSEVLRDVDLFVGVASVGNDPTWADGGPGGRHREYWTQFSFGDLTANGQTRKAVLERLIPRLKIAPRCTFRDRFLVVRGDLRTYKIHLGSGNVLMDPGDQYLCIVTRRDTSDSHGGGELFLPFEGDNTLSLIVSKALLLANDARIADPTILSQIKR